MRRTVTQVMLHVCRCFEFQRSKLDMDINICMDATIAFYCYVFFPLNVPEDKNNTVLMCYICLYPASNGAIICSPAASDALAILLRLSVCECTTV